MQTEKELIGIRIKNLRKKQKLTQEKLCELADIDQSTLSRIENGDVFPSLDNFIRIIKALHTNPNSLLDFINFDSSRASETKDALLYELISNSDSEIKNKITALIKAVNKLKF